MRIGPAAVSVARKRTPVSILYRCQNAVECSSFPSHARREHGNGHETMTTALDMPGFLIPTWVVEGNRSIRAPKLRQWRFATLRGSLGHNGGAESAGVEYRRSLVLLVNVDLQPGSFGSILRVHAVL
jgi:hypothetical protein